MKNFKTLFYAFFILTFTSCNDVKDVYGLMDSPCNPDWLVQIIVKNINRAGYPITVHFKSADNFPSMLNGYESSSRADSAISLEGGGWKIEDDGKYKKIKYSILSWGFYPYIKENHRLDKQLVGKDRKVKIRLLDKDQKTIFENQFSVAAVPYKAKTGCLSGYTLYDTKKLEVVDTTYLTHLPKTGKNGNCYTIFFDLNKQR